MTNESNPQTTKLQQEYDRRLLHYEKDFDITLSRIASREKTLRESMLAYSERVRSITNARVVSENKSCEGEHLVIRAKHIPKHRELPKKRRPLSLDELIGVNSKQVNRARKKPKSASRLSLPSLPDRLSKNNSNVKVSFVSASDLYDIVDYSLKNKGKRNNILPHHHNIKIRRDIDFGNIGGRRTPVEVPETHAERQSEKPTTKHTERNIDTVTERKVDTKVKPRSLPPLEFKDVVPNNEKAIVTENKSPKDNSNGNQPSNNSQNKTHLSENEQPVIVRTISKGDYSAKIEKDYYPPERGADTPQVKLDALKRRPNRAKRMKLHEPELVVIPEGDVVNYQSKRRIKEKMENLKNANTTVTMRRSLGKVASKPDLEIILESEVQDAPKNDSLDSDSETSDTSSDGPSKKETAPNPDTTELSKTAENDSNSLVDSSESPKNSPHKKTKAQRRFKKLIFLRDVPEWYYQRL